MSFTLRQLHVFQQVAATQSITQAAESLFMTPPAISKQINNLTAIANASLFETIGKKLILTREGQQLLVKVQLFLQQAEQLSATLLNLQEAHETILQLSVINSFQALLFPVLKHYRDLNPLVSFNISIVPWAEQAQHFSKQKYDFYFTGDVNLPKNKFLLEKFDYFQFVLVANSNDKIRQQTITPALLARSQFVSGSAASESQQVQEKYFKKWRIEKEPLRVDSYMSVAEAVKAGLGIALLPNNIAAPLIAKGELVQLDYVLKSPKFPIMLVSRKDHTLTQTMRHFRDYFLQHWREKVKN